MIRDAEDRPGSAGGGEAPGGGWWINVRVDGASESIAVARHLERFGCRIAAYGLRGLRVEFPYASTLAAAEAEAGLYLSMWRAAHPRFRGSSGQPYRPPRAA